LGRSNPGREEVLRWKRNAARGAAELVEGDQVVGLGSGTTVAEVVVVLAERRPRAVFVPASRLTEELCRRAGLRVGSLEEYLEVDFTIDGADEVSPQLDLLKGRGGAHTREKLLALASEKLVIAVDRTKLVGSLGERMPVPVEVLPFGWRQTGERLRRLGGRPSLRKGEGGPFLTDNGNYVLDVRFGRIARPGELERRINSVPGVVENGIFSGMADIVVVGHEEGCTSLCSRREWGKFVERLGCPSKL